MQMPNLHLPQYLEVFKLKFSGSLFFGVNTVDQACSSDISPKDAITGKSKY